MQSDSYFESNGINIDSAKFEDPCDYYAGPVTLNASCRCPHLDAFLPTTLDSGGFGILSTDEWRSNNNNMNDDDVGSAVCSRRVARSIDDLHFASLHSRPDLCNANNSLAGNGGTTLRGNDPILDRSSNGMVGSKRADRSKAIQNHTDSTTTEQSPSKYYPFGEEEYKTDVLSSGGVSNHYYPILPGHFMERAKNDRSLDRATREFSSTELDKRKRCRSLDNKSVPGPSESENKEDSGTISAEAMYSDTTKTDVVTGGGTSSLSDYLHVEEEKETSTPTSTTLKRQRLGNHASTDEEIDSILNPNAGRYHLTQSRYEYLQNMKSMLSKQQEMLSATQVSTENYEHFEKKKKTACADRSTQKKQKEQLQIGRSRNINIKDPSTQTKISSMAEYRTSLSQNLPTGQISLNQKRKHQEKAVLIAANKVEEWLEVIRQRRINYWRCQKRSKRRNRLCAQYGLQSNDWDGNHDKIFHHRTNQVDLDSNPHCKQCSTSAMQVQRRCHIPRGDELMQCLECSMIACGPVSLSCNQNSKQHLLQHFLTSGHSFGITCGALGGIFCMKCGDFVHNEPLEAEKERVDIRENVGFLGWKRTGLINRSFGFGAGLEDFLLVPDDNFPVGCCNTKDIIKKDHGDPTYSDRKEPQNRSTHNGGMIVWRGFRAVYPHRVLNELVQAAHRTYHRWNIFHGKLCDEISLAWSPKALKLSLLQNDKGTDCWKIQKPVGFYNMGNTCFMNSVLQCIVNLRPLQRFFLCEVKHDYVACRKLRKWNENQSIGMQPIKSSNSRLRHKDKDDMSICLACEMDKLFQAYYSGTIGINVSEAIDEPLDPSLRFSPSNQGHINSEKKAVIGQFITPIDRGEIPSKLSKTEREELRRGTNNLLGVPLITSDLLFSAWKCKEMAHLAGYEQRDAHEFLQALLDVIGKHCNRYRDITRKLRQEAMPSIQSRGISTYEDEDDSKSEIEDIVEHSFGGSLRSVLMCEDCGFKRSQPEPFLNVSLPVATELISVREGNNNCKGTTSTHSISTRRNIAAKTKINLQACLDQFTLPEPLGDPVDCPSCKIKTSTLKQLSFAKLPKILCLHLKRFDALTNKKITNPVSFPIELDMGPHLPHWCEVEQRKDGLPSSEPTISTVEKAKMNDGTCPKILYDLCGTIDHTGTLNQGHYVSNVQVNGQWYHCNDAFVGKCGKGTGEEEVLSSDSAYMMFYVRKGQS